MSEKAYEIDLDWVSPGVEMVIGYVHYHITVIRAKDELFLNYAYIVADHGKLNGNVGTVVLQTGFEFDTPMDALAFGCTDLLKHKKGEIMRGIDG